ncbi:hypothetical protein RFI_17048, partial [Reticulomyxa filosa]
EILIENGYLDKNKPETHMTDVHIPKDIDIPLAPELVILRSRLSSGVPAGRKYEPVLPAWMYIYRKYIDPRSAPYMINVSWKLRITMLHHYQAAQAWSHAANNRTLRSIRQFDGGLSNAAKVISPHSFSNKSEQVQVEITTSSAESPSAQQQQPSSKERQEDEQLLSDQMLEENFLTLVKDIRAMLDAVFDGKVQLLKKRKKLTFFTIKNIFFLRCMSYKKKNFPFRGIVFFVYKNQKALPSFK